MAESFSIHVPDDRLARIRQKLAAFDWDQLPDAGGWSAGVGKADLIRLVSSWLDDYDWRVVETRLNRLPQFVANIDGETIHYVHLQGAGTNPPLLLLHGWPGSFMEFEALIHPLRDDGHDVVVPSLPGFGFSNPISGLIGPRRAAELMRSLMEELFGDRRYVVQGGDWGSGVGGWMAQQRPDALLGLHVNMLDLLTEGDTPNTEEERRWNERRLASLDGETGYAHEQETRPQTLGAALADNPVGTAAWILEKFGNWADLPRTPRGPDLWARFPEHTLITNIMLYVATGAIATSLWMYHGKRAERSGEFPAGTRIEVPTGVAAFRDPVFLPPPRSLAERSYNIVHWTEMPRGGHFAALEEPDALLGDLRAFLAKLGG